MQQYRLRNCYRLNIGLDLLVLNPLVLPEYEVWWVYFARVFKISLINEYIVSPSLLIQRSIEVYKAYGISRHSWKFGLCRITSLNLLYSVTGKPLKTETTSITKVWISECLLSCRPAVSLGFRFLSSFTLFPPVTITSRHAVLSRLYLVQFCHEQI